MRIAVAMFVSLLWVCMATGAPACRELCPKVAMAWSIETATIVVAHDGRVEGFDRSGEKRLWIANGLATPSAIVVSADGRSAAILDGFADCVAIVSIADGAVVLHETPGTPVAATFFGRDVWIALRDRNRVIRITPKGEKTEVAVALDPALIGASDKFVYVYSRVHGLLQEIDPRSAEVTRNADVGSAGSDLEIQPPKRFENPGPVAYLCRPMRGSIEFIDLVKMESHEVHVGDAPVDLLFVRLGSKLSIDPFTGVMADPGKQALLESKEPGTAKANVISLPAPVDRLFAAGAGLFALDSSSGTVYRIDGRNAMKIASGLTATSFVPTDEALFTWDAKSGRLHRETIGK